MKKTVLDRTAAFVVPDAEPPVNYLGGCSSRDGSCRVDVSQLNGVTLAHPDLAVPVADRVHGLLHVHDLEPMAVTGLAIVKRRQANAGGCSLCASYWDLVKFYALALGAL